MKFIQKSKIFVTILTTSLSLISASTFFAGDSQHDLTRIMARSSEFLQRDPTRYMSCFQKYIELVNYIASTYETNFKGCLDSSRFAAAKIDETTFEDRYNLINEIKAACALLRLCSEFDSVEEILQCYADEGYNTIQTMYDVHVNATEALAALRERYYLIRNEEYKCTNDTKRSYEKASAEKYTSFNDCILGNSDIFIEPTSTTPYSIFYPTFRMLNVSIDTTSEHISSAESTTVKVTTEKMNAEVVTAAANTTKEVTSTEIIHEATQAN